MLDFLKEIELEKFKFEANEHCEPIYIIISEYNWNRILDYFHSKEDKYFMLFGIKTIYSPALSNEDIFFIK